MEQYRTCQLRQSRLRENFFSSGRAAGRGQQVGRVELSRGALITTWHTAHGPRATLRSRPFPSRALSESRRIHAGRRDSEARTAWRRCGPGSVGRRRGCGARATGDSSAQGLRGGGAAATSLRERCRRGAVFWCRVSHGRWRMDDVEMAARGSAALGAPLRPDRLARLAGLGARGLSCI